MRRKDAAWVERTIPRLPGRKSERIREVRRLVSAIEQLDTHDLDGRRMVAHGLLRLGLVWSM
ncbi:MAG: hypothetical protein K0V04_29890 [Deltaproteobacteria bacterium]|nr:hypothetical protein [Deltaproteobacteria bacterium]